MAQLKKCGGIANIACPCDDQLLQVNLTYFVDQQFGDDGTGAPNIESQPYQTINGALLSAPANSIIYVQPGTYNEGTIQLRPSITWYFTAGAILENTTFTGVGDSVITGFGTFISDDVPIINYTGSGRLTFTGGMINYTGSGYAIEINGTGMLDFLMAGITATNGILFNSVTNSRIVLLESGFVGGQFINIAQSSGGLVDIRTPSTNTTDAAIYSRANNIMLNFQSLSSVSTAPYFLDIVDPTSSVRSFVRINVSVLTLVCYGLITATGISTVADVLMEPSVNISISEMISNNINSNPIVILDYMFCNLVYDQFSFNSTTPIPFLFIIQNTTVFHVTGAKTFISDTSNTTDIGLFSQQASTFCLVNANLTELFTTSRLIESNGNGLTFLYVRNLNNQIVTPGVTSIANNSGQVSLVLDNASFGSPDGVVAILNNGEMMITSQNMNFQSNNSEFIQNQNRLQARINRLAGAGDNNILINNFGTIGLTIGNIPMFTSNSYALINHNQATLLIGLIDATFGLGNEGIRVTDGGQLYGTVQRILANDRSCIYLVDTGITTFNFGHLENVGDIPSLMIDNGNQITLNGGVIKNDNSITSLVRVRMGSGRLVLNISDVSINQCELGLNFDTGPIDVLLNIGRVTIYGDIASGAPPSGINVSGRCNMRLFIQDSNINATSDVPYIRVSQSANLYADLSNVLTVFNVMTIESDGEVYYKTGRTNSTDGGTSNVICTLANPSQSLTLDGTFITRGKYNLFLSGGVNPNIVRILNAYFINAGISIDASANPPLIYYCNGGVSNTSPNNATEAPIGTFLIDPTLQ